MKTSLNVGDSAANVLAGRGNVQVYNQISPETLTDSQIMPNDKLTVTERDFAQIERLTRAVEDLTRASYELRIELQKTRSELRDEFNRELAQVRAQLSMPARSIFTKEQLNGILTAILIVSIFAIVILYLVGLQWK